MDNHVIDIGEFEDGERLKIDLDEDFPRFALLVGRTGSGKSVFHSRLYRELMRVEAKSRTVLD